MAALVHNKVKAGCVIWVLVVELVTQVELMLHLHQIVVVNHHQVQLNSQIWIFFLTFLFFPLYFDRVVSSFNSFSAFSLVLHSFVRYDILNIPLFCIGSFCAFCFFIISLYCFTLSHWIFSHLLSKVTGLDVFHSMKVCLILEKALL